METFLVYGLVVAFFVLLAPIIYLLVKDPLPHAREDQETQEKRQQAVSASKKSPSRKIAYGVLAALFTSLCALTAFVNRTKN